MTISTYDGNTCSSPEYGRLVVSQRGLSASTHLCTRDMCMRMRMRMLHVHVHYMHMHCMDMDMDMCMCMVHVHATAASLSRTILPHHLAPSRTISRSSTPYTHHGHICHG